MPGQPVVLDELGGLVATARPEDLPRARRLAHGTQISS